MDVANQPDQTIMLFQQGLDYSLKFNQLDCNNYNPLFLLARMWHHYDITFIYVNCCNLLRKFSQFEHHENLNILMDNFGTNIRQEDNLYDKNPLPCVGGNTIIL